MKCSIMLHYIWVFTVCKSTHLGVSRIQRVNFFPANAFCYCRQLRPRLDLTFWRAWSGSKLFDTLIVLWKNFEKKVNFEKNQQTTKNNVFFQHSKSWIMQVGSGYPMCLFFAPWPRAFPIQLPWLPIIPMCPQQNKNSFKPTVIILKLHSL